MVQIGGSIITEWSMAITPDHIMPDPSVSVAFKHEQSCELNPGRSAIGVLYFLGGLFSFVY
jgi:hypothetical protein